MLKCESYHFFWVFSLSLSLFIYLSIYLSIYLPLSLSLSPSLSLSLSLSSCLSPPWKIICGHQRLKATRTLMRESRRYPSLCRGEALMQQNYMRVTGYVIDIT